MREWTRLLVSLCCRRGVRSGSLTQLPFRFHHPSMIPCDPNTNSNKMTCDTERQQCPRRLLPACPLRNLDKGPKPPRWHPSASALSSMHPGCRPSVPTLAPPATLTPPLWGSTNCPCFTIFHIVVLVVDSVRCHSCIFPKTLHRIYDICLSLYHSTNSSNKTGPEERKAEIDLIRGVQGSQLGHIHVDARVYSQAPSSS